MSTTITYVLVSLAFSAFFSGMEIAFVSANKLRVEIEKKNGISGAIIDIFLKNPNQFISTMLVGNNIALVVYGLQMALLLEPMIKLVVHQEAIVVLIQTILSTLLILFAGEFIPKTIFKINPNMALNIFAIPLFAFYIVLYPISIFTSFISQLILRVLGLKKDGANTRVLGKVDLDYFIQQSIDDSSESSEMDTEVKIFQNALDFSSVRLRDCMIPRNEIVACELSASSDDLRAKFIETGLSKILVYKNSVDDIVGYIHSSELFNKPDDWTKQINTISLVPETMAANKLMKVLMQTKKSIAVVVDEFGGTSGIVTLEDLVEEIFGDIEDEHDVKSLVAKRISETEFVLSGRLEISTVNEKFGLSLPESDEYLTLAGWILHVCQRFPKLNETLKIDKYTFKILNVTSTKIELVRLKLEE
ncbi:MAG TPA: hemolysin [Porphyromonadaceae bacterium]|nr:hemolysin [Porphyromonadaceae bacterium]